MEPRLTLAELRQRMLWQLSRSPGTRTDGRPKPRLIPASAPPIERVPWRRVVMEREVRAFFASLPYRDLDVVEIGGHAWSEAASSFRSYRSLDAPPYAPPREPLERNSCGLVIFEHALERTRRPRQALAHAFAMLRPGGSLVVNTGFLLKLQAPDLCRWTEDGLRVLLEEAGFTSIDTGSWGNRQCLAADLQPGLDWTGYDPAVHSLENEPQFPLAVWAFARKPATRAVPTRRHAALTHSVGVVVLSKNGAGRIVRCLESILESRFADELVVCVDSATTDDTASLARRYTPHVHLIETGGTLESALPSMAVRCSTDYLLRIDDDETLGGNWDRLSLEALVRSNGLTHLLLPRCWLVPADPQAQSAPRFIASEPWFPDYQVRFFQNDPGLIRWPANIHDPMEMKGRGMILFDRWIEHHDLVLLPRSERERKAERYRQIRPDKHLSNLYLYEEQPFDLLPADRAGFAEALENYIGHRAEIETGGQGTPYRAGAEIRFDAGGNAAEYLRKGWSTPEDWGCWTNGLRAEMRIPLERPFEGAALLEMEALGYVRDWHPTLHVRVVCNREPLGAWAIESSEAVTRTLRIPASAVAGKRELLLVFHLDNPASPADSGEFGLDQRLLGLGAQRLWLTV